MHIKISCAFISVALALITLAGTKSSAQSTSKSNLDNNIALPLDPAIRKGKLANGFTYLIRKNNTEKGRAVLYLVNKVGSILETDSQQGLAHFLEHMNFNGTTHFPGNKLVDYLEKAGVRFGADLNAYTSYDETVYQLPLPFDKPQLIDSGLLIMRDWAHGAILDPKEIDKERGVILEEMRLGQGLQKRMNEQIFPLLVNGSKYASRSPIGKKEILTTFRPETIRSFYNDWYRPDLQCLIIVGDIDVKLIEEKIQKLFATLKNPANTKLRTRFLISLDGRNHFLTTSDRELQSTTVELVFKHPARQNRNAKEYRAAMVENLFNQLISLRFADIGQQSNPGYINAGSGISHLVANVDALNASVTVRPGEIEKGFKSMWKVISIIKQQGFSESELKRAKEVYRANMQLAVREADKVPSAQLTQEYVRYILNGEAAPGIKKEAELVESILPGIHVDDLNQLAKRYITAENRDIIISATESDRVNIPSEKIFNTWLSAFDMQQYAVYKDDTHDKPLLENLPPAGTVVSTKEIKSLQLTEVLLSNGVKVVLKPTKYKNDEIRLSGFRPGGTFAYSDAEYLNADAAAGIVNSSGIGDFSPALLRKKLSGKNAGVSPYISERFTGVNGGSTSQDLETALQLIHLYFTSPRKDTSIFNGDISRARFALANNDRSAEQVFQDTINAVLGNHHIRRMPMTPEKLDQINIDKAIEIYKERFGNANGFTFIFTGNFDVKTILPLLEKYLGSLPSASNKEPHGIAAIRPPAGIIQKTVYKSHEDKATVRLVISGDYDHNTQNNLTLRALKEIVEYRLLDRLRETEGGVYTPGTAMNFFKLPYAGYQFTIVFGCAPGNVDKLISSTWDEINKLKKNGPLADDLKKFKAEQTVGLKSALEDNAFWQGYLTRQYQDNEDPEMVLKSQAVLSALGPQEIQKAANTYLSGSNYIRFVLLPDAVK